jgi:signal transduction histidine kinase
VSTRDSITSLIGRALRPPLADRRFWVVQGLVLVIAIVHEAIDLTRVLSPFSGADIVPVALFLIPVVYAALNFGLIGSFATAGLVTVLTIPDTLVVPQEGGPWPDLLQLGVIDVVALFVGHRVERERVARELVELAEDRFRALFETNRAPILVVAADGSVVDANPAAGELFGPSVRGARLPALLGLARGAIASGDLVDEVVVAGRTFRTRRTEVTEGGGRRLVQVVLQDVTEERRRQGRLKEYARSVIRGHEEERRRIAQEIHDEPVQELVHLLRVLDVAPDGASPATAVAVAEARRVAEQTMRSLRDMARGLRPPSLDDLGLAATLRRLGVEFAERTSVEAEVEVAGDGVRLDPDVELGVFRIAQEALRNIEHHAGAHKVSMRLVLDPGLRLTVTDDGRGFDPGERREGALGLLGMQERAQLLGGRLEVRHRKGGGTVVDLELASAPVR